MSSKINPEYRRVTYCSATVLTNGCFDLITVAHIRLLQRAALFGKRLVVAVNSDSSVASLKGPGRPLNNLADRMEVIASLSCVDEVTSFPQLDVGEVIGAVRPHCWIKGGDYTMESLNKVEVGMAKSVGCAIVILEKFGDYSTTGILEKLKA